MLALETVGLTKFFGSAAIVSDVSLRVPPGAIYGFLGANGAGKTTTIKLLLGLLRPDRGQIRLFGAAARTSGHRIGALVEAPSLYDHLTGRENLDTTRHLLGLARRSVDRVLELVDLADASERRVGGYSLGMRQRLAIARALLGEPELLILDEPTNGLDPDGIRAMRDLLRHLAGACGVTLIVSSHLLAEIEQVATHVGMLHHGRLLAQAPLAEMLAGQDAIELATADDVRSTEILVDAGFKVTQQPDPARLIVAHAVHRTEPAAVAELLVTSGQRLSHLARHGRSLEAIYHQLIHTQAA